MFLPRGWPYLLALLAALAAASPSWAVCPSETEVEVVRLLNRERAGAGLAPLEADVRLVEAARRHSQDMADGGFFSHTGSDGSSFADRCRAAGYPMTAGGEDIAAGYASPAAVVEGWMNSPGHRQIILTAAYRHVGVGYVEGGSYGRYWTADFGASSDGGRLAQDQCGAVARPSTPTGLRVVSVTGGGT